MKIVAVGFKVEQENSVYYRKVDVPNRSVYEKQIKEYMGQMLYDAKLKGAEFVSVRFIGV